MPRGKQVPYEVRKEIELLTWEGVGPAEIERQLERSNWKGRHSVDRRTIQRIAKEAREKAPPDPSGPWSLNDENTNPDDLGLVRSTLATRIYSGLRRDDLTWPSRAFVDALIRVRRAAPGIPGHWLDAVARAYYALDKRQEDARYLDLFLVMEPWKGEASLEAMLSTVRCARPLLGPPDVLAWVLGDIEVFDTWDEGGQFRIADERLRGPCNRRSIFYFGD